MGSPYGGKRSSHSTLSGTRFKILHLQPHEGKDNSNDNSNDNDNNNNDNDNSDNKNDNNNDNDDDDDDDSNNSNNHDDNNNMEVMISNVCAAWWHLQAPMQQIHGAAIHVDIC